MPIIHADVDEDTAAYLEEWAEAVGCGVHDVAGDAIVQFRENRDDR